MTKKLSSYPLLPPTQRPFRIDECLITGPAEVADVPTTVTVTEGGPILLRGDLELRGSFPAVRDTRMALCVCTRSARLPFCDAACTNPAA